MRTVDVGALLDEGEWSGYQKLLVVGTALTIILDGIDNQLLAAALPTMMREWTLPRSAFATVLMSGMLGMMIGGATGGIVGDRIGRRGALLGSVISFGVLTVLVSFSTSVAMLGVLRFLVGLGLGGAMPNAAALSSEYVPIRHRAFAVTFTIVCIPLGGTLAGLMGAEILPAYGWRMLFLAGGIIPLVLAALLWNVLPESPRFLARNPARHGELSALLGRLRHSIPADAAFVDAREQAVRVSASSLFVPEFRRDTLALCASFFFCLLTVYVGTNWVTTVLQDAKFSVSTASYGLTFFNLGGVVGAVLGAFLITRLGSRLTMLSMAAGSIAGAVLLASVSIGAQPAFAVLAMLGWTGGLINAVQTTMYALAAHVYPTSIRATGVGTAVAVGRIGGVVSPYLGAWAIGAGGAPLMFAVIAIGMTLVFAALASVRNHVPRVRAVLEVRSVATRTLKSEV